MPNNHIIDFKDIFNKIWQTVMACLLGLVAFVGTSVVDSLGSLDESVTNMREDIVKINTIISNYSQANAHLPGSVPKSEYDIQIKEIIRRIELLEAKESPH